MKPEWSIFRKWPLALVPIRHLPTVRHFGVVSLRQCSSYASVRLQRLLHLIQFYKLLYNERTVASLLRNIYGRWYRELLRPKLQAAFGGGLLLSATAFSFVDNGIHDDEMLEATNLFDQTKEHASTSLELSLPKPSANGTTVVERHASKWEPLIKKEHFHLHRRPIKEHSFLYEYRCTGTYTDITPVAFFVAQMDLEYRKQWDHLVVSLDIIDVEKNTNSEVVRWISHYPYPMYPREYVYVRRACVNSEQGVFVLTSKSVEHPSCPRDNHKRVRVDAYYSCMVIKAHGKVDQNGFDYVLTYFDDPKAPFPQFAYNWMVNTGVLGFLDKVHNAAKVLSSKRSITSTEQQLGGQSIMNWQRWISERYNYSF